MASRPNAAIERLESRRLLSAVLAADRTRLVYNDPVGGAVTAAQTVTFRNTGTTALTIPAGGLSVIGTAAARFKVTAGPTGGATVAPGGSFNVAVTFAAAALGPQGAALRIKSNAANATPFAVTLRGLGTRGVQGTNEPSLQWILDTYQIPVRTGDAAPAEPTLDLPPRTPNDEVPAQMFVKAGTGPVTVTPLAVFSNPASPALTFGYYTYSSATAIGRKNVYTVLSADVQTVNPRVSGSTGFDPGAKAFGLLTTWAAQNNRTVYSEDFRNTFINPASARRMFRAYPLKNPDGTVVPNAYVLGNEEAFNHDYQDAVFVIRNVRPLSSASAAPSPSPSPSPSRTPTPAGGTTFQAENAVLTGAVTSTGQNGFTGTGYADFQNATGDSVRWTVNAAAAGTKTLTFRYANGGTTNRPLALRVNNATGNGNVAFAPTGGWTTWRTVTVTVHLVAGANSIVLTTTGANGPNLDAMTVA